MEFQWDEKKNRSNIDSRNLDFALVQEVFDGIMLFQEDTRIDYEEKRVKGYGFLNDHLMVVVFAERIPNIIRVISFRKANSREQKEYEQKIKNHPSKD